MGSTEAKSGSTYVKLTIVHDKSLLKEPRAENIKLMTQNLMTSCILCCTLHSQNLN